MSSPDNTTSPIPDHPPAQPSSPVPQSTAGAWLGLVLVVYGACSLFLAALAALPALIAPRIHDAVRVQFELNRVEGAGGEVFQGLLDEIGALVESFVHGISVDAGVTALLGGGLLLAGLGISFRREGMRRFGVVLAGLKLASLIGLGWFLLDRWVPVTAELMATVDEFADMATRQSGKSVRNPFAFLGSAGVLRVWMGVMLGAALVPSLLALCLVRCRAVRQWCDPERIRTVEQAPQR